MLVEELEQVDTLDPTRFLERDREAEPRGIAVGGGLGNFQEITEAGETVAQQPEVELAGGDEAGSPLQLGQATCGLHVRDLQVVAEVGIDVFVVVALREAAKLLGEAFAAGVVAARGAVAVAAPVAEGFCDGLQLAIVGEHGAAFAHRDVVCWVEAEGGDVAPGADHLAVVGGAQRVAAVFDKPQAVFVAERLDLGQVEGVAQGVGEHDRFGLGGDGRLNEVGVDVVGLHVNVDEHRDGAELHDRVDGGREARGNANDFVAFLDGTLTELGRSEGAEGDEVGRRAGVDGDQVLDANELGQLGLELGVEPAGGEPAIERSLNHQLQFACADDFAGRGDHRLARLEGLGCVRDGGELFDEFADFQADSFGGHE